jgi:putative tryptophan/tyrosine transport system substrate-binding protein
MRKSFPGARDAASPAPATLVSTDSEQFSVAPKTSPALCARLILLETVCASRYRLVLRCEWCETMPGTPRMTRREFVTLLGTAAAAWPLTARGQQPATPVIGFLGGGLLAERRPLLVAFRQGLAEAGYVERQNVAIEYLWAEGQYDRLPALAADLVRRHVTVLVAGDGPSALAAKAATTTIPIVFSTGIEPVQVGLVASLSRPGGNLTGFNLIAGPLPAKQLGLLHELVPAAKTMGVLINPNNANAERDAATVQETARAIGLQVLVIRAVAESDFETGFATMTREGVGALLVNSDVFFTGRRDQIIALASRHALPLMSAWREFPLAGGLISYGPSLAAAYRQIGAYTAKILNGAKPADLPVMQPTTFELVINLKTAKALNLNVPLHLEQLADEVIE